MSTLADKPIPVLYGQWAPDRAMSGERIVYDAKNVLPGPDGFMPLRAIVTNTGALTERCRGAATFRKRTTVRTLIAGDRQKLYKFNAASMNFDDISDAVYTTQAGVGFWDFCQFGDLAIMTNLADPVKKYNIVTAPATVSSLGGTPPQAMFCKTIGPHVMLAHLENKENYVHWSAVDNAEGWTAGTNLSDEQEIKEGGRIMNLMGGIGDVGYAFQERSVKSLTKTPGSPLIFQIEIADPDRGCAAFRGGKQTGNTFFYLAHDGFMRFVGGESTPIAFERVENWFYDNAMGSQLSRVVCGIDPRKKIVMWSFVSTANAAADVDAGFGDRVLIHNWAIDRWAWAELDISAFVDLVDTPYTLDTINSFGNLDVITPSFDSAFWNGDNIATQLGVFSTDFKLGAFAGAPLEAIIELKNIHIFAPKRQFFRSAWPISDASELQIAVAPVEDYSAAHSFGTYMEKESTGEIPIDSSARAHSLRQKILAGDTWTHTKGVMVDADPDGWA